MTGAHRTNLDVAVVVSSVAAESRVNQHSVQKVVQGLSVRLRHKWAHVQVLRVPHILGKTNNSCYPLEDRLGRSSVRN